MVDTTDPYAGIFATLSANPSLTSIGQALRLRRQLREASPGGTGVPIEQARELIPQLSALPGLAPTDYSGQRDEANQMAKLQLGLALAARGFGSMGAQPRPGEMAISTVGRELLAPLGGDAMTVAQQLYDQKLKRRAAEKAEKAALSQAALSLAASQQEGELGFIDAALKAELSRARIAPKTSAVKDVQLKVMENGKEVWRDIPAISLYSPSTGGLDYIGPGKVELVFDPESPDYNARILSSGESGSAYQTSKSSDIVINAPLQEFIKKYYGIDIPDSSVGKKATMETYLPKGGQEGKPRYNVLDIAGVQYDTRLDQNEEAIPPQAVTDAVALWQDPSETTPGLTAGDYNLFKADGTIFTEEVDGKVRTPIYRVINKGENIGKFLEIGTNNVFSEKDFTDKGLTPKEIRTGTAATPRGIADPEFQDSFAGFLAKLSGLRQDLGLGKKGLVFDTAKFNINPELKPGEDFPFSRFDKVPLTEAEQATYATKLRKAYLNVFESIKTGEVDREDLNKAFVQGFLDYSIENLGLPAAPAGTTRTREQITNPAEITQAYKKATENFRTNRNAAVTIQNMPFPKGPRNMTSGNGKLVLFDALGVPFGTDTQAPPVLPDGATPTQIDDRAASVRSLDSASIQERILAERLSKSATPLGSKLRPTVANTREKQLTVVGDALENKKKTLDDALADSDGKQIGETVGKTLDTIAMLDRLDAMMILSGLPGFVRGPIEAFFKTRLDIDAGAWFRTDEGQRAAGELMANLPLLHQFVARELLKGTGEQRISTPDLEGAQETLVNINKAGRFNEDQLRALRGYLVNSVTHSLEYVGDYGLPERTLEKAAQLGIDVKSIEGRNGFYSPYLKDQRYAVTKHPVPSYSRDYQTQLRDKSIFGYVARESVTGVPQYELIQVDEDGQPIWDDNTERYQTITVPGVPGWQAEYSDQKELDFNRNFLIQTYRLDR